MTTRLKTLGKIAGGVGTLLLVTSVLTLFVTSGDLVVFAFKLGLGIILTVFWALTNGDRLSNWARSAFFYSSSVVIGLVFVVALVALNFIVARRSPTWDLTAKRVFSLSEQTVSTLRGLKTPVKATAFVENGTPEAVEELFARYHQANEQFSFEFKDPRRTPDLTAKYQIHEGQSAAVLVHEGGFQLLNLGRLANPQMAEQELTNGLIKLDTVGSQKLYFVVGHNEWPLEPAGPGEDAQRAALQARRVLEDEGYSPESLNLAERGEVPPDASAVVIAGARSAFAAVEQQRLEDYLSKGGRLLLFTEPGAKLGLDSLLAHYGFQIEPGLVADSKINPEQPYLVISPFFSEHEITKPLAKARLNVVFATTSAITLLKEGLLPGVTTQPLVLTTPYAWIESTLSEHPTLDSGERTGQLPLAALAIRDTAQTPGKRSNEARLLVFGDSELLVGTFGLEPNRNLVMNTFAWATQQAQKITIRPPDRDISTIDLTADTLSTIRLLSMDVLPTLLIAIGLTIWLTRRAR